MPNLFPKTIAPFFAATAMVGMLPMAASALTFTLQEATIEGINKAFNQGALTSEQLVQLYLNRINTYDFGGTLNGGQALNSVIRLNPNALAQAAALDLERQTKGPRSALHGIPILLKDNIDTDFLPTTAGFLGLANSTPPDNAFITQKLIDAGAIVLGKASLTEFANFLTNGMPAGYSSLNGYTFNPYNPFPLAGGDGRPVLSPGGSSAGPGASVAANLVTIAIGTETSGSILSPSNQNSLVGIKPTVGLVSRDGVIPIAASQDTAGPMTRTVADAAALLNIIAGYDPSDPITVENIGKIPTDYRAFLDPNALNGKRIGYYNRPTNTQQLAIFNNAIATITSLGATVIDAVGAFTPPSNSSIVLSYEFKRDLNAYLTSLGASSNIDTIADVDAFITQYLINNPDPNGTGPFKYGKTQVTTSLARDLSPGSTDTIRYLKDRDLDIQNSRTFGIDKFMSLYNLDSVLYFGTAGAGIGARAGYPTIIVPAGYQASNSSPQGISFLGKAYEEPKIIGYAYAFEQATLARVAPSFTPPLPGETITVPEPSSVGGVILIGFGALALRRRQRLLK
jgi:amidase